MQLTLEQAMARIAELEQELDEAHQDSAYGCLTRAGVNSHWRKMVTHDGYAVVFLDMDDFGKLNKALGYAECNRRVAAAMERCRGTDISSGRWFSGDELIFVVPAYDAIGFAYRMRDVFRGEGIGVTVGIAPVVSDDLVANVKPASDMVQAVKAQGNKGGVHIALQV